MLTRKLSKNKIALIVGAMLISSNSFAEELYYGQDSQPTFNQEQNYSSQDQEIAREINSNQNNSNQSSMASQNYNSLPKSPILNLPKSNSVKVDQLRQDALKQVYLGNQSLTPDQLREMAKIIKERSKTYEEIQLYEATPEPLNISMGKEANKQSELIKLARGQSSVLTVTDSNGHPWNIDKIRNGNSDIEIERLNGDRGNIIALTSKREVTNGNIVLLLSKPKGATSNTFVIILNVKSGDAVFNDKINLRIESVGPNTPDNHFRVSEALDSKFISWVDGVVPSNIKELKTNDKSTRAYQDIDGGIVLVTESRYRFVNQNLTGMLNSADGQRILVKLPNAKMSRLHVEDLITGEYKEITISGASYF